MKIGDLVNVVDSGARYSTYKDMFDYTVKKFNLKNVYFMEGGEISRTPYRVIALTNHLKSDEPIALIANKEGRVFIFGYRGLEII